MMRYKHRFETWRPCINQQQIKSIVGSRLPEVPVEWEAVRQALEHHRSIFKTSPQHVLHALQIYQRNLQALWHARLPNGPAGARRWHTTHHTPSPQYRRPSAAPPRCPTRSNPLKIVRVLLSTVIIATAHPYSTIPPFCVPACAQHVPALGATAISVFPTCLGTSDAAHPNDRPAAQPVRHDASCDTATGGARCDPSTRKQKQHGARPTGPSHAIAHPACKQDPPASHSRAAARRSHRQGVWVVILVHHCSSLTLAQMATVVVGGKHFITSVATLRAVLGSVLAAAAQHTPQPVATSPP